ncbi:hypothetical protein [Polaromonas jejuensis]|uniref:Uncharacterized protein n=1 Tax=Polaromonas jejuensis TaxID=457502 RepID=A0ABW0QAJ2_9BURK|nr:hypothetical protein [Polaromonas jejuensis]
MFITNEAFHSPVSAMFGGASEKYWTMTELALHQIWFIASCVQEVGTGEDAYEIGRTLFLSGKLQLEELLESGARLEAAYIVTPAHINGGNGWHMEPLARIWNAAEPDTECQRAHVFETVSGQRYTDSMLGTPWEALLLEDACLVLASRATPTTADVHCRLSQVAP